MKIVEKVYREDIHDTGEEEDVVLDVRILDDEGNSKGVVSLGRGEPEDMTLSRDLGTAYNIADMLKYANKLGLEGKELDLECIEVSLSED